MVQLLFKDMEISNVEEEQQYKRLKEGYTDPTLPEAVPGDLGLVLPYNTMKSIIEMIEALDNVTPGIANEHTLLYGVEANSIQQDQK